MRLSSGKIAVLIALGVIGALIFYWFVPTEIRYRLTIEVDNDGETVAASSVIAGYYYRRNPLSSLAPGTGRPAHARGVAPIIDLGPKGTLIAALSSDAADMRRRGSRPGPTAVALPLVAYDVDVHYVETVLFRGPVDLSVTHHPTFIWIPPNGDWRGAKQFASNQMPLPRLLPGVRVRKVTFAPIWFAPMTEVIKPAPVWLLDLRRVEAGRLMVPAGVFNLTTSYIETICPYKPTLCGSRPSSYVEPSK